MTLDTDTDTAMANSLAAPPPTIPPVPAPVLISVDFRRAKGQCLMIVDARELHAYLDRIGVERDATGRFKNQPAQDYSVIDTGRNRVSAGALLKPEGPHEFNLLTHYSAPPSRALLAALRDSIATVVDTVIDHYRPIEISVRIHAKGSK